MMGLRIVKHEVLEGEKDFKHGLKVMIHLLDKWAPRGCIVCADSYFASVQAAVELYKLGWRFIGVVKTATTKYPMDFMKSIELPVRGTCSGMIAHHSNDGLEMDLLAFVYCDKDRHYFISSCSNISAGEPIKRFRVRQVEDVSTSIGPERVQLTINCPKAAAIYYSSCGKIDQHNRCRQDTLDLEKKIETKVWHRRVNMSIFGMVVVDSWMLYKGCTGGENMTQSAFYKALMTELIDNPYYNGPESRTQTSLSASSTDSVSALGTSGCGLRLTPTKRKVDSANPAGERRKQRRCRICQRKTIMVCSLCRNDPQIGESGAAFCAAVTERECFRVHMCDKHY